MRNSRLDLSVDEVAATELSIGRNRPVDMSVVELENVATPDLSSFIQSMGVGIAISSLVIAT